LNDETGKIVIGTHSTEVITMRSLELLIRELPPEAQKELRELVQALHAKYVRRSNSPFRFDWAGALSHLKKDYTSVQMQHETLDIWGD
jgi:hypothetical protein